MEDVNCDICFINFDDKEHIPKVLECGHTFCLLCINNLQRHKKCPNCNQGFPVKDINGYPTNYSLLKTINAYKTFASSSWNIKCQIDKLKSSLVYVQEELRDYASIFNEVTEAISKLENLRTRDYNELEIIDTLQNCNNCQKILSCAENFLKFKKKDVSVKIRLKNFNTTFDFMSELTHLIKNKTILYAVIQIEQEYKFGKLCLDPVSPNMLFMHSLSDVKAEKDSQCIWFSDLKKCFIKKKPFTTFIEVPTPLTNRTEKILIFMNNTALSCQFMKICAGETGASYRGAKCGIGFPNANTMPLLSVSEYLGNNETESGPVDYDLGWYYPPKQYKMGTTIIKGSTDGGFKMLKVVKDSKHEDIIGQVLSQTAIQIFPNSKVVDSGLVFPLETDIAIGVDGNWR